MECLHRYSEIPCVPSKAPQSLASPAFERRSRRNTRKAKAGMSGALIHIIRISPRLTHKAEFFGPHTYFLDDSLGSLSTSLAVNKYSSTPATSGPERRVSRQQLVRERNWAFAKDPHIADPGNPEAVGVHWWKIWAYHIHWVKSPVSL